ncbi:MAG: hypothetical protein ACFFEO_09565, partial [Candidatus Thorarchaeota archaeon]
FSSFAYFLPLGMYSAYMIAFSVFLIIASQEKERTTIFKNLLKSAAIVNLISITLLYFFPIGSTAYSPTEQELMLMYLLTGILPSLLTYIPKIYSFGIVFFIYGYKNRSLIKDYLKYTGIFWLIFTIWASITLFSPFASFSQLVYILDYIYNLPSFYLYSILFQIFGIGGIFNSLAVIFLLIHAFVNSDSSLKIAGFIYFIGNATIGLSQIALYIQMIIY